MSLEDEKDYLTRVMNEMVRVLFSLMLGKKNASVEMEQKNKYEVAGKGLAEFFSMIDNGKIDEAENLLLEGIDYSNKEEVAAAALFYHYLSEKDEAFLKEHDFSEDEVFEGMKNLLRDAGYGSVLEIVDI